MKRPHAEQPHKQTYIYTHQIGLPHNIPSNIDYDQRNNTSLARKLSFQSLDLLQAIVILNASKKEMFKEIPNSRKDGRQ